MRVLIAALALVGLSAGPVQAELARAEGSSEERYPGIAIEYGSVEVAPGVSLRTILSKPEGVAKPPVIVFVQWLSCGSVELPSDPKDGWSRMLRGMLMESGWALLRSDKRGVGDSAGGPCSELDYDTELADHRQILAALKRRDDVDTGRIVIFGASMGSRMAPQLAAGAADVVGVLTWGGGSRTWYERMLAFDRHALELGGSDPAQIAETMVARADFHRRYLIDAIDPPQLIANEPALQAVWEGVVGTSVSDHYGRPFAFHQQAQRANWAAAWAGVNAQALMVMGEHDWFESSGGHLSSLRAINHGGRQLGEFRLLPGIDHHFTRWDSAEAAFADAKGEGVADERAFLDVALPWLEERRRP